MGRSVQKEVGKGNGLAHSSTLALAFQKQTANVRAAATAEQDAAAVASSQQTVAEAAVIPEESVRALPEVGKGKEIDQDGCGPPPKKACFPKTGTPVMSVTSLYEVLVRAEVGHVSDKSPSVGRSQKPISPNESQQKCPKKTLKKCQALYSWLLRNLPCYSSFVLHYQHKFCTPLPVQTHGP